MRDGTPNRFRGVSPGNVELTAQIWQPRPLQARTTQVVRHQSNESILRPLDPARIELDSWLNADVARGEVLVEFHPAIPEGDRLALLREYALSRLGYIPGVEMYQMEFDTKQWTLQSIVSRLGKDPRVALVAPNVVLKYTGIPPYVPSEIPAANPLEDWHFHKIEAYEAFGLMRTLQYRPSTLIILDSGISVTAGKLHIDLADRVDLVHSVSVGQIWESYGISALRDTASVPHGTLMAGIAAAAWDNGAAAGIDPHAGIVMIVPNEDLYFIGSDNLVRAMEKAAELIDDQHRIVLIAISTQSQLDIFNELSAGAVNVANVEPLWTIIRRGGLVIIAAGNHNQVVTNEGIASIKTSLTPEEKRSVLVVGGTQVDLSSTEARMGPENRFLRIGDHGKLQGSNYAPSNYKELVDIAAPAVQIYGSGQNNKALAADGTSFAAPQVAGIANVLFSLLPMGIPASEVSNILLQSGDPIWYGPETKPLPRLRSEPDRLIGNVRVNFWQALLFTLNRIEHQANKNFRYMGLRVTADRGDLELWLDKQLLAAQSVRNEPSSTAATRITLTNKGQAFPQVLVGKVQQKPIYEQKLLLDPAGIDKLEYRPVKTIIMYTGGAAKLKPKRDGMPANRALLSLENLGVVPTDVEMLDPIARRPWDKSLRPWMKLANGDSYTMTASVVSGPPGVVLQFLDSEQRPFPAEQVDDEGHPYLTVPFGQSQQFYLDAQSTPALSRGDVQVDVTVMSLNNRLVKDTARIVVRPQARDFTFTDHPGRLVGPLAWNLFGELQVRYGGQKRVLLRVNDRADPPGWYSYSNWADGQAGWFDPGQERILHVDIAPPTGAPAGTEGTCFQDMTVDGLGTNYSHAFRARVADISVTLSPSSSSASKVLRVPGQNYVYAEFPMQIANLSPFPVRLRRRYIKYNVLMSSYPEWFQLPQLAWDARGMYVLKAEDVVSSPARLYFDLDFAYPPVTPPTVAHLKIALILLDPLNLSDLPDDLPPDHATFYTSNTVAYEVTLQL